MLKEDVKDLKVLKKALGIKRVDELVRTAERLKRDREFDAR